IGLSTRTLRSIARSSKWAASYLRPSSAAFITIIAESDFRYRQLGREVVEGQQRVAILDQALDRLVVFDAPGLDEGVERHERILLGLGHPDLLQRPLGFRLLALR